MIYDYTLQRDKFNFPDNKNRYRIECDNKSYGFCCRKFYFCKDDMALSKKFQELRCEGWKISVGIIGPNLTCKQCLGYFNKLNQSSAHLNSLIAPRYNINDDFLETPLGVKVLFGFIILIVLFAIIF